MATYKSWAYKSLGDYHKNLDMNWPYAPTYIQKIALVDRFVASLPVSARILDAGCGEGVLVEKYRAQGRQVCGIDANYSADNVQRGGLTCIPFEDAAFDAVLFLDVFEHISFAEQPAVLRELRRVLKRDGWLVASIPNLAHLNSRLRMFFRGELDRTDAEVNHVGERPFGENRRCLEAAGFEVVSCHGITLTVPLLYRRLICRRTAQFRWLHDLSEPVARRLPHLAYLAFFVCRKRTG